MDRLFEVWLMVLIYIFLYSGFVECWEVFCGKSEGEVDILVVIVKIWGNF